MSKNRDLKKALLAVKTDTMMTPFSMVTNKIHSDCSSPSSSSTSSSLTNDQQQQQYKRTRYSGVGRYRCPWKDCSYTPHFLRDLRRHMFKHTGDKRYKCTKCSFVSVWKTSLLQHQRKKHSMTLNVSQ
ncbi:Zinc-finger double domain containing protein [Euroglyphus maynei]|uniref:Zinc-finger double domain containing protein n=1 Tax=Euroglyphus maynei TaxID=6958 RepID=A0A1Y3BDU2_EURMA|nr:Zinc-finger double domain containing protein [Euroglyphus maynei]